MSKYPTIMNLKSVEKEIETLIKAYDQGHRTYLRSLKQMSKLGIIRHFILTLIVKRGKK